MRLTCRVVTLWAAALLILLQLTATELHASDVPIAQSGAAGDFHLGAEALSEVELSRPGCPDSDCPWWLYGNTFGTAQKRTVGLVFRTVSFGPISSRMHCFNTGCDGAASLFPDASDNFNATGGYYCAAMSYDGFSREGICGMVAPGAYVLPLITNTPFEAGAYLAGGFKTGGDREEDSYLNVYDIHFIYEGPPTQQDPYYFGADSNLEDPLHIPPQ